MCDYSLHLVKSRPAKVGDKLVSTKFPNGRILLVNRLCEGQYATVLQLPVTPLVVSEVEKQKIESLGG